MKHLKTTGVMIPCVMSKQDSLNNILNAEATMFVIMIMIMFLIVILLIVLINYDSDSDDRLLIYNQNQSHN